MAQTTDALQAQIDALKAQLAQLTGQAAQTEDIPPDKRPDYIPHGSDLHAAFLGLRKAGPDDELDYEGWTLQDINAFGVLVNTDRLLAILKGKVHELIQPIPALQSADPAAPNYAPTMWRPQGMPVRGIVGGE